MIAAGVGSADLAVTHQVSETTCDRDLAAVSAHALNSLVERRVAAFDRVRGHRTSNERRRQQVFATKDRGQHQRSGHLRTVQ